MAEAPIRSRQRKVPDRVMVSTYLTQEIARRLDIRAEDENRSRSDVIRKIIEDALLPDRQREAVPA